MLLPLILFSRNLPDTVMRKAKNSMRIYDMTNLIRVFDFRCVDNMLPHVFVPVSKIPY